MWSRSRRWNGRIFLWHFSPCSYRHKHCSSHGRSGNTLGVRTSTINTNRRVSIPIPSELSSTVLALLTVHLLQTQTRHPTRSSTPLTLQAMPMIKAQEPLARLMPRDHQRCPRRYRKPSQRVWNPHCRRRFTPPDEGLIKSAEARK